MHTQRKMLGLVALTLLATAPVAAGSEPFEKPGIFEKPEQYGFRRVSAHAIAVVE